MANFLCFINYNLAIFFMLTIESIILFWQPVSHKSNLLLSEKLEIIYFVDANHGNDEWSGILEEPNPENTDGPVRTIQKAYANIRFPASTIYVKAGIYRETLNLSKNYPVIIKPRPGDEGKVIISGADLVPEDRWQKCTAEKCAEIDSNPYLSNIYYVDLDFDTTQIFQNGMRLPRSRYPKEGYLFPTAVTKDAQKEFVDENLAQPDHYFEESYCHIRTRNWSINQLKVEKHADKHIGLMGKTRFDISKGSGYYFTNIPKFINQPRQWAFLESTKRLYFYPSGSLQDIEVSRRDYGITTDSSISQHIISGLIFRYANRNGIQISEADHILFQGNTIEHPYKIGINIKNSRKINLASNVIKYANNEGIRTSKDSSDITIKGNYIYATGAENYGDDLISGVGTAIINYSPGAKIYNNRIDKTGYHGIYLGQRISGTEVSYNHITNTLLSLADGGAIYTGSYYDPPVQDFIRFNIIENAFGYTGGIKKSCTEKSLSNCRGGGEGIYLDERTSQRVVENNTVINASKGIFLHWTTNNEIRHNTLYGNKNSQIWFSGKDQPRYRLQNNLLLDNILYATEANQRTFTLAVTYNDLNFGYSDRNYFFNSYNNRNIYLLPISYLALDEWQVKSGFDKQSKDISSLRDSNPDFSETQIVINPSMEQKDINFHHKSYCDVSGKNLDKKISLAAFESKILIPCASTSTMNLEQANP